MSFERAMEQVADFHRLVGSAMEQRLKGGEFEKDIAAGAEDLSAWATTFEALWQESMTGSCPQGDLRLLRVHLMIEELAETMSGIASGDEVHALDGLADLMYVAVGTAVTMDLPLSEAFDEVHRSNMTKKRMKVDDYRIRHKGDKWEPPNLERVMANHRRV